MAGFTIRYFGFQAEILEGRALFAAITFGPPTTSALGAAFEIAAGDVNGDGLADVVVGAPTNVTPASVRVHLGIGSGRFAEQPVATLNAGADLTSILTADFNRDGKIDVACSAAGPATNIAAGVTVFLGQGGGAFASPISMFGGAGPQQLAVGDVNRDGRPDLVSANEGIWSPPFSAQPPTYGAGVLLGNGDGTFQMVRKIDMIDPQTSVALGDFNGDTKLDAAFGGPFLQSAAPFPVAGVFAALGDGAGGFGAATTVALVPGTIDGVDAGDLTGDHRDDVAIVRSFPRAANVPGDATVHLFFGRSPIAPDDAPLVAAMQIPLALTHAAGISIADFNRDARLDLAVAGQDARPVVGPVPLGALAVISAPAANTSVVPGISYFAAGPVPLAQAVADLNSDGRPDVVMANSIGATSLLNTSHSNTRADRADLVTDEVSFLLD